MDREQARAILWKHLGVDTRYEAVSAALDELAALSPPAESERVRVLEEALRKIVDARMAIDGGSIDECRRIASAALNNPASEVAG